MPREFIARLRYEARALNVSGELSVWVEDGFDTSWEKIEARLKNAGFVVSTISQLQERTDGSVFRATRMDQSKDETKTDQ